MNTNVAVSRPIYRAGLLSLVSVSLTAVLAAISHAFDFGPTAFVVSGVGIGLLWISGLGYLHTGNRLALVLCVLLNLWTIVGFGFVGGFWNHAVKLIVCSGHGGMVPADIADWFISPVLGGVAYEAVGVVTFAASVAAAVFGYRFVRSKPSHQGPLAGVAEWTQS